ncbi:serine/arginine repetitive matrix protein 2 [Streptomyces sp. NPDC086023]|uniref:serine/arginine repetitive matrix protein 2 n=1 Tax=Streptomyces sp. NPDC086023 TaxID=3365746 RepID=UPI0037D02272
MAGGGPAYDPLGGAASVADAETRAAGAWPGHPGSGALPALPPHPSVPPRYGPTGGPFVPPPPPPPPRPAGQGWLTPLTAGVAVAALAAGAAVVWFVQRGDGAPAPRPSTTLSSAPVSPTEATGEASPTPSDPPSDQASPSPSPSAPAGYRVVDDPAGFRIAVPEGWRREELKAGVFYRSADRTSLVQVFRVNEPGMTPLEAVQGASEQLSANPGFTQIEIGDRGDGSAELVYEYDSAETGSRRRGVERVLTTPDGRMYAVLVAAPASEWPVHREVQAAALKDFAPTS